MKSGPDEEPGISGLHAMNKNILQIGKKSFRQFANARYNGCVEIHAQAPRRRLLLCQGPPLSNAQGRKLLILQRLQTPVFQARTTRPLSITCTHSKNIRGYTLILPILVPTPPKPVAARSISHSRFSDRRLFPMAWSRSRDEIERGIEPGHDRPILIITCNKKAIYSKLTAIGGNAVATNDVYQVNPVKRTDLQENDR